MMSLVNERTMMRGGKVRGYNCGQHKTKRAGASTPNPLLTSSLEPARRTLMRLLSHTPTASNFGRTPQSLTEEIGGAP